MAKHTHGVIYELRWQTAEKTYRYVGQSVELDRRVSAHRRYLQRGDHHNQFMTRVWAKHGDFEVHVLEQDVPVEDLAAVERRYIEEIWGQEGCLNGTRETINPLFDPEIKARAAEALRAVQQTDEWKRNNKAANQRKAQDPEWRTAQKAGAARAAQDPSWRAKIKAGVQKRWQDPAYRKKHAAATREANSKKVELTMPGEDVRVFESLSVAAGEVGVSVQNLSRWLTGVNPWPGRGKRLHKKYAHLVGLQGRYIE